MSEDETREGDSAEREEEKRARRHEAEERETEEHAPADRAGRDDPTEESVLDALPGARANKPTG